MPALDGLAEFMGLGLIVAGIIVSVAGLASLALSLIGLVMNGTTETGQVVAIGGFTFVGIAILTLGVWLLRRSPEWFPGAAAKPRASHHG